MNEQSPKDEVLESTVAMASGNPSENESGSGKEASGAVAPVVQANDDTDADDDVMDLDATNMVADADTDTLTTNDAASGPDSSPPQTKELRDIPMARISVLPPRVKVTPIPVSHDELFELQEGHVVEEGDMIVGVEDDSDGHDVDFGSPEMVFDGEAKSGSASPTHENAETGVPDNTNGDGGPLSAPRDAQMPEPSTPEGQPEHAVPVNQPPSGSTGAAGISSVSGGTLRTRSSLPSGAGNLRSGIGSISGAPGKRVSVEDLTAAVFDDAPVSPDDAPRESTLDNYVGYMRSGDSIGPAMASPEEAFPGMIPGGAPESEPDAESEDGIDEDGVNVDMENDAATKTDEVVDIDVEHDVEEMEDPSRSPESAEATGGLKPPPLPPLGAGRPVSSFFKNDKIDAANASLKLMAKTARKSRGKKREWWATIFDDEYLMLLPERSPYEQQKQIDFIQRYLGLPPGALLLDLACGNGRNSIGMAQRNYRIVGVDLSLSMLARAGDAAQEAGQKINFIHGDMRDLGFDKTFDGVFSLDTSFGYFDEPTNIKVLQGIYRALKPGGTFLLELANRDFVIRQQPNMVWFQMDNMVCMEETDFNYINNRLYISRQLIIGDNEKQSKHEFSLRLYSLHEIGQLLHLAGFAVIKVSGHRATPGAFFGPESSKLIIIAERRGE
jgi:SAM-dependent methyltransferase